MDCGFITNAGYLPENLFILSNLPVKYRVKWEPGAPAALKTAREGAIPASSSH